MKNTFFGLAAIMLAALGCQGSAGDPATLSAQDLNPPGNLVTVTQDGKIELRWLAGNGEKDFQGFYVFGTTKALADIATDIAYPSTADISQVGIPRCKDNTGFWEAFG